MTLDYGFKVSKPGYDVKTATPEQLVFSSKYPTLRVQQRGSGTITHTGGRTHTIAHNLGYVPMFSVIGNFLGASYYSNFPFYRNNSTLFITRPDTYGLAWADSTNLYIKVNNDFGYVYFETDDVAEQDDSGYWRGYWGFGHDFFGTGDMNGAIRFSGVNISRYATIYEAQIGFYVSYREGSSNMYNYIYGIDEDNTGDFGGGEPFGRAKTDARTRPEGNWSSGNTHYVGVTSCVQEIVNRSGWNSGNHMGFTFYDDPPDGESPAGNGVFDGSSHVLKVLTNNTLLSYKYTIFKDKIE